MSFTGSSLSQRAYRSSRPVCLFIFILVVAALFVSAPACSADDTAYLETQLQRALAEQLHRDRYWQILLHYKPDDATNPTSLIDDPSFFLSPVGKTDPAAELAATLRGIFRSDVTGDDAVACRFPARTAWLRERLGITPGQLPAVACRKLDEALATADPRKAVLVFPSAHINSPASMFGHTLLRIDNRFQNELLAYSVSYAAHSTDTNGVAYAFKGIFGLYPGRYTILPYYEKVKEYNDIEHRDVWEYHLNLTEEECRRMVLHVWEVQGTYSDYYFFDENCSYNLLFFLEAARPQVRLTDKFFYWVIPSDTIRVVRDAGFVASVKYRPSQGTRIRYLAAQLPPGDQQAARAIAEIQSAPDAAELTAASPEQQGRVLELAAEFLQYRYNKGELSKEDYNNQFHAILKQRSRLGAAAGVAPAVPVPVRPDAGHATGRAGLAAGVRQGRFFTELTGRFAYHDIMDPDDGYIPGAQINFGDSAVRYYPAADQLQLQRLHFIDILSLSPRNLFFQPLSWKVNFGFDQELFADGSEHLAFRVNSGGGMVSGLNGAGLGFILAETDLLLAEKLEDKFAIGIGGSTGFVSTFNHFWKIGMKLSGFYYPLIDEHSRLQAALDQNFRVNLNNSISVSLKGEHTFGFDRYEVSGGWNSYF
jgi:hypothetical protein